MLVAAVALWSLSLFGPPELPPDIGELPPAQDAEPPAAESPPPSDEVGSGEADAPAPEQDAPEPAEPAAEDEAIEVTPDEEPPAPEEPEVEDVDTAAAAGGAAAGGAAAGGAAAGGAAAGGAAAAPAVQKPGTAAPAQPSPAAASTTGSVEGPTPPSDADSSAAEAEPEPEQPEESYKKLGGFRLFRIGLAAKIGYTNGTSAKNGLYDRDKSIQDSIDNMMVTTSGAGDLGKTRFGGFAYGFILDAEVVGINVWLDFHKFFQPGGMWSLLLGYDHEFGFGKRLRLDVGVAGGLNHVFLGSVLNDLYYDKSNPEAVNIGTLGVEGRGMVDLHIKLVGPLFTGPYGMIGYHYLWSANVEEVTAEKGLHYSAGWSLRLDFAAPKLIGGRKKQPASSE